VTKQLVALVAACALALGLATSALAGPANHFPEGVPPAGNSQACEVVSGTPASVTGSATGSANKTALFVDACEGGP
jgi:hypothetical protein